MSAAQAAAAAQSDGEHITAGPTVAGKPKSNKSPLPPASGSACPSTEHLSQRIRLIADSAAHELHHNGDDRLTKSQGKATSRQRENSVRKNSTCTAAPSSGSQPSANTFPVLVNSYHETMGLARSLKRSRASNTASRAVDDPRLELPPLSAFSFHEILAAIDPDVRASIDTIAEICGKSKLSLANEYGSHRPPQSQLDVSELGTSVGETQHPLHRYLETVEEAASVHEHALLSTTPAGGDDHSGRTAGMSLPSPRSASRALLGCQSSSSRDRLGMVTLPVTQTCHVSPPAQQAPACMDSGLRTDNHPSQAVRHLQALTQVL